MSDAVDAAADELYGLPLDEFVPRRDALARALRVTRGPATPRPPSSA